MANVLPREKRIAVLRHLCEGNSMRATARITGVHLRTIQNLLIAFGARCAEFMDRKFRGLHLTHVETDEIWTYVGKHQRFLTAEEKASCHDIGDIYLWTCIDKDTKLCPCFLLGKRSADNARRLMKDLASRLVFPTPHQTDAHAWHAPEPIYVTQLSTDGFSAYPEAVDLAFGGRVKYGQCIKDYRNANVQGYYAPPEIVDIEKRPIFGMREQESDTITTSHVERHNGTIRTLMKRFTRLTLGYSKKLEALEAAVAVFLAYYNFCWRTRKPHSGSYRVPAAMAAGVIHELWDFERLYDEVTEHTYGD
ncbi:MAG: hypothetical protein ACLQNE_43945 [Thermoguttaceae bacterium]